jgi:hypothetical protein
VENLSCRYAFDHRHNLGYTISRYGLHSYSVHDLYPLRFLKILFHNVFPSLDKLLSTGYLPVHRRPPCDILLEILNDIAKHLRYDFYEYIRSCSYSTIRRERRGIRPEEIKKEDSSIIRQVNLDRYLVHIYELDYSEEIPSRHLNEWINLLFSIQSLFYWLIPDKTWGKYKKNQKFFSYKTLAWGLLFPSLLFIYWYSFTLSFLLISLANILDGSKILFLSVISADIKCFFDSIFACVPDKLQHLFVWISVLFWIVSVLCFPLITFSLEKAQFVKEYLESEFLRIKIRNKVLKVLNAAIVNQAYTEVTIISHSFGVLIGADSIGHALSSSNKSIKFISLGNSLSFLSRKKYKLTTGIIEKCIGNLKKLNKNQPTIPYWIDYRAEFDWLSNQIENLLNSPRLAEIVDTIEVKEVYSKKIESLKKIGGLYHLVYFQDESYLREEDKNKNISVIERILKEQI